MEEEKKQLEHQKKYITFKKENCSKGNKETQNKLVIFVPATPEGEQLNLLKGVQRENHRENKVEIDFQIIEQAWLSLQKQDYLL